MTRLTLWKRKRIGKRGDPWGMPVCIGEASVL
jgi:hypothetical protein